MTYRCAACGNGEHLTAYVQSVSFGRLAADGADVLSHDETYTCFVFGDSVSCVHHGEGDIEVLVDGAWSVWSVCERCGGRGRIGVSDRYPDGCWPCEECTGGGGRYVPAGRHEREASNGE